MRILYCHCRGTPAAPRAAHEAAFRRFAASGAAFDAVDDLCGLAAGKDPLLKRLAGGGPLAIAACAPRAVRGLFAAAGAPLPQDGVTFCSMREPGAEAAMEAWLAGRPGSSREVCPPAMACEGGAWTPWFPVIDYDRCTHCMQCLSFCLFGVFENAGGRLQVVRPTQCKPGCPACARVCPEEAILFPKSGEAAVNGAESDRRKAREALDKIDVSALLGGDAVDRLRARNAGAKKRFSIDRNIDPGTG